MAGAVFAHGDHHYRAYDGFVRIWLFLMAEAVQVHYPDASWLMAAASHWHGEATVDKGFVDPYLDGYVISKEQLQITLGVARKVFGRLSEFTEVIPKEWLNERHISSWIKDVAILDVVAVGNGFIDVLERSLQDMDFPCE